MIWTGDWWKINLLKKLRFAKMCLAVMAHQKIRLPMVPGMEIGYVVRDAKKWQVDTLRDASEFDSG